MKNSPEQLLLVRHGQSAGNVARDAAEAAGSHFIDIATRDMDVPLSELGKRQAAALGRWLAGQAPGQRPTVFLASPYLRARQTAELALGDFPVLQPVILDERLREREFGVIDRLTKGGIEKKFPDQAELHARLGKFYYRPPGGESWCDVIQRLRGVLETLHRDHPGERVMIVCHSVVVLCFRYLLERMSEEEILAIDRKNEIVNCSLTAYEFQASANGAPRPVLKFFNIAAPLEEAGEKVTSRPDAPVAPK